jgi:dipeptidyl aminopeptidase/acylaminoacyl peptidase
MRLALVVCVVAAWAVPAATSSPATARNGFIVYVHEAPRHPYPVGIWFVLDENMWTQQRLPFAREYTSSPHWSADGRRLVFRRESGVYTARYVPTLLPVPSFARPQRIARLAAVDSLDWSPDGTSVVLAMDARPRRRRSCTDIYTMRANGSDLRRLTTTATCETNPAWSPDGLEIAFERADEMTTKIAIVDVLGRNPRTLGEGTSPAWAPDGRSLALLTREAIVIIEVSTGLVQRTLKPDLPYDTLEKGLAWSPDGARLVHGFHDLGEAKPVTHLAIIDADGTNSFRLTQQDTFPDMEPDWQPICDVNGTDGDDVLTGTPGDDLICALRGDDRIRAGAGNDTILGGDGNDRIHGGDGSDRLFGAAGNDRLYALDGMPDVANGGPGRDRFWGDQVDTVSEIEVRFG